MADDGSSSPAKSDDVVCTRTLSAQGPNGNIRSITARLMRPRRIADDLWKCDFDVVGPDGLLDEDMANIEPRSTLGIDSLQALSLGIVGMRALLESSSLNVSWLGEADVHGIDSFVSGASRKITRHLENLVNDENEKIFALLENETTRAETLRRFR